MDQFLTSISCVKKEQWISARNKWKITRTAVVFMCITLLIKMLVSNEEDLDITGTLLISQLPYTERQLSEAPVKTIQLLYQLMSWLQTPRNPCKQLHQLTQNEYYCSSWKLSKNNNNSNRSCLIYTFSTTNRNSDSTILQERFACRTRTFNPYLTAHRDSSGNSVHSTVLHVASSAHTTPARVTLNSAWHVLDANHSSLDWLRVQTRGHECLMLAQQLRGLEDNVLVLNRINYISLDIPLPKTLTTAVDQFRVEMLAEGTQVMEELGFRLVFSHRLEIPSHDRHTSGVYRVLLQRSGPDVWDRLERRKPAMQDYSGLVIDQVAVV